VLRLQIFFALLHSYTVPALWFAALNLGMLLQGLQPICALEFSIRASVFGDKMNCSRGGRLFPLLLCAVVYIMAQPGACNVVLIANNTTLSFSDVEATFSKRYTLPIILVV
jgi:hypothetical protein